MVLGYPIFRNPDIDILDMAKGNDEILLELFPGNHIKYVYITLW